MASQACLMRSEISATSPRHSMRFFPTSKLRMAHISTVFLSIKSQALRMMRMRSCHGVLAHAVRALYAERMAASTLINKNKNKKKEKKEKREKKRKKKKEKKSMNFKMDLPTYFFLSCILEMADDEVLVNRRELSEGSSFANNIFSINDDGMCLAYER